MKKIFLGVLTGLITWGCLVSVGDYLWIILSPGWYGKHQNDLQMAIIQNKSYMSPSLILTLIVLRSCVFSVISGFITATVAYENYFSTLISGCLLFICGFLVHLAFWEFVPYWYHFFIFLQFIPFTILGGRLVNFVPNYQTLTFGLNPKGKRF